MSRSSPNRTVLMRGVAGIVAPVLILTLPLDQAHAVQAGDPRSDETPTFFADVLPILQASCQSCHQPAGLNLGGMVAPMSLVTYEETRPWADAMALAVKQRRMPPWHASEAFKGTFHDERYLEAAEVATIVAWAEGGAPEGTRPANYQPPRETTSPGGWALGEPDLILEFDESFYLDEDIADIYVTMRATLTEEMLPEDRWIKSVEYRPGPHVHHILRGLGGLAPGNQPTIYEDGYGRLLEKGTRVIEFDMHYNKPTGPGTGTHDNTVVGVRFMEPGEVVKYRTNSEMLGIMDFVIPPGNPSYSASREYSFREDVLITGFLPHMHLRGKSALYEITYPDGRHEQLLHVPKYDFSWQHSYDFLEPVLAPAGSTLRFTLWWDNSANNPSNPDPTSAVRYGEPTTAEMGFGFMATRRIEEDHIIVGQPLAPELRAAYGGSQPMTNDRDQGDSQ